MKKLLSLILVLPVLVIGAPVLPPTPPGPLPIGPGANVKLEEVPLDTIVNKEILGDLERYVGGRQVELEEGEGIVLGQEAYDESLQRWRQSIAVDTGAVKLIAERAVSAWTNATVIVSNDVLKVDVLQTNGWTTVWSSKEAKNDEIDALKQQAQQLLARVQALEEGGGASSWNEWAADGTPNPEPSFMTLLNRPATMFASGFAWETSGAYALLVQTGTVAFASSPLDGEFRIGPNSTNYFGFALGGTVMVGARCRSFRIEDTPDGKVAKMVYDYSGAGDPPTLLFTSDLSLEFSEQTGVAWELGADSATVTAPATATKGFWAAVSSRKIDAVFRSTMPAEFRGGVFGATNAAPVRYDSTITIQQGGATYRIPAEAVR